MAKNFTTGDMAISMTSQKRLMTNAMVAACVFDFSLVVSRKPYTKHVDGPWTYVLCAICRVQTISKDAFIFMDAMLLVFLSMPSSPVNQVSRGRSSGLGACVFGVMSMLFGAELRAPIETKRVYVVQGLRLEYALVTHEGPVNTPPCRLIAHCQVSAQ